MSKPKFSVRFHHGGMSPIDGMSDLAERSAFATTALAVKLRELEEALVELHEAQEKKERVYKECERLFDESEACAQQLSRVTR